MSTRRAVPAFLASAFALLFFGLGNFLGARQNGSDEQLAALRAEIALLKHRPPEPAGTTGNGARAGSLDDASFARARCFGRAGSTASSYRARVRSCFPRALVGVAAFTLLLSLPALATASAPGSRSRSPTT